MTKLTRLALEENRLTLALALFVVAAGTMAFLRLPQAEDPPVVFRYALITSVFPGASAELVEREVTAPVEQAVRESPEVEWVSSISRQHASIVVVKLQDRVARVQPVWDRMRRNLEAVAPSLPDAVEGPDLDDRYGDVYGVLLTISSDSLDPAELATRAEAVRERLLRIADVGRIRLLGEPENRVTVRYDDAMLAEANLSGWHLKQFLEAQNLVAPGGAVREGDRRHPVEAASTLSSVDELDELQVLLPGAETPYYFGELVEFEEGPREPPMEMIRAENRPAVVLAVSMRDGGSVENLGRGLRALQDELAAAGGSGDVHYGFAVFEPERVQQRVDRFFVNLGQSLLIVGLILVVTLGLRTGTVVAVMMPLVVLASLGVMLALGLGIDLVALAAFVVVLGIMVDNHIVIGERILRLRDRGVAAGEAAVEAVGELAAPLVTATLVTITGFLPLFLAESTAGEYVTPLFTVVTIALLVSTLFAFSFTPALTVLSDRTGPGSGSSPAEHPAYRRLSDALHAVIRYRWAAMAVAVVIVLGAGIGLRTIPRIFFPPSDRPLFTLELEYPLGTAIEKSAEAASTIDSFVERELAGEEGPVRTWSTWIGRNAPRYVLNHRTVEYSPEYAFSLFATETAEDADAAIDRLQGWADDAFPDAMVRVRRLEAGPAVGFPVKVQVSGTEVGPLRAVAAEVAAFLEGLEGVVNVNDDWGPPIEKYRVVLDEEAAALAGITRADLAAALQAYLTGLPASSLQGPGGAVPIFVKADVLGDDFREEMAALMVYSRMREKVAPLGEVASIEEVSVAGRIARRDFSRTITVQADVAGGINPSTVDRQIAEWLAARGDDGSGIRIGIAGEGEESDRANRSILQNLPWSALIIVLLLLKQMRSFRRVLVVLSAVPLGFVGVVVGLIVSRQPFGFTTLVGIVSLTGIVINNAIILLDRIRLNEARGELDREDCIVEAVLNRIRPVLLTALTTIGGILPLYLRSNPTWQPMAAAILFGLFFSTLLVLFVLPAFYAVCFGVRGKNRETA